MTGGAANKETKYSLRICSHFILSLISQSSISMASFLEISKTTIYFHFECIKSSDFRVCSELNVWQIPRNIYRKSTNCVHVLKNKVLSAPAHEGHFFRILIGNQSMDTDT